METQRECSSHYFMDKDGRLCDQAAPTHSSVAQSASDACRGHLGDITLPCSHSGQAAACLSCLGVATDFKRALMCSESSLRFDPEPRESGGLCAKLSGLGTELFGLQ